MRSIKKVISVMLASVLTTSLEAGDSGSAEEMLKLTGVDLTDDEYVEAFMRRFKRLIDQFESIS